MADWGYLFTRKSKGITSSDLPSFDKPTYSFSTTLPTAPTFSTVPEIPVPVKSTKGLYDYQVNVNPYPSYTIPQTQYSTGSNLPNQVPRTGLVNNTVTDTIPTKDWAVIPNGSNTQLWSRHTGQVLDLPKTPAEHAAMPLAAQKALKDYSDKYSPGGLYNGSSPFGYFSDEFNNINWGKVGATALQGLQALSIPFQVWNAFQQNSLAKRQIKNAEHIARLNYDAQKKFYEENKSRGSGGSLALAGNYSKTGLAKAKQHDKDTTLKEFDEV